MIPSHFIGIVMDHCIKHTNMWMVSNYNTRLYEGSSSPLLIFGHFFGIVGYQGQSVTPMYYIIALVCLLLGIAIFCLVCLQFCLFTYLCRVLFLPFFFSLLFSLFFLPYWWNKGVMIQLLSYISFPHHDTIHVYIYINHMYHVHVCVSSSYKAKVL